MLLLIPLRLILVSLLLPLEVLGVSLSVQLLDMSLFLMTVPSLSIVPLSHVFLLLLVLPSSTILLLLAALPWLFLLFLSCSVLQQLLSP